MKRKLLAALLAALMTLTLAACNKDSGNGDGKVDVPTTQTGTGDFQKNLHQTDELSFIETDTGYYFSSGSLFYIEKETMTATRVCAKPDCDHTDPDICNSRIQADYLLTGGEKIYYVGYVNSSTDPKQVKSVKYDATERDVIQELKFRETSAAQSSYDQAIYHRGYIFYVSDDILYRVKLGEQKDSAKEIWSPENAGEAQSYGGQIDFNPNGIHYTLWAEGDTLYFMANVQTTDGTYKDVLFQCDLTDMSVEQVWVTPGKDEVGAWETTGVKVSQWYVTNGYIYFYLSGGDMWRTELATGKLEKLADTHEQTQYGSAIFSDDYMCLLNDMPVDDYANREFELGSFRRSNGDTIFVYGIDGTLLKEISLKPLFDELGDISTIKMLMCDATDVYFLTTSMTFSTQNGWSVGNTDTVTLCRANFETGEVTQVYKLR